MKELGEIADWFIGFVKKFGLIVAIVVAVGYLIKRAWFWFTIPVLLAVGLECFYPALGLNLFKFVCLWIASWTLIGKVFKVEK